MPYKTIITKQEVEAVDIPAMEEMTIEDYKEYVRSKLTFIDHHDLLRSGPAEYPIACTQEQLEVYIKYLNEIKSRLKYCY